ncbi:hypothetical protein K466DRAFT_647231 [Polyporus arcularius HHB13444]|uniref:Uncharacterized protein n=1 Tax=Polyporus arcularius HHB13444 TaxID=1314778 RepID=A0A5C3P6A5_9APHY|nr:hypothetical protein K466DRAFT_647231 [Polyporus arcularius HHB13444]
MLSSSSSTSLRDVPGHTSLNFYVPVGHEQPYQYVFTPPEGIAHHNLDSHARPIYDLHKTGFQYVRWPSAQRELTDPGTIKTKSVTSAKRALPFDHNLRLIAHKPLAARVGDWRTVGPDDLVSVRLIYPHREGSTFSVRYNPNFRFHYLSDQTPNEVTLIKCFDSAEDGTAGSTPHSAFTDSSPSEAPYRQSIEVRALVFDSV